MKKLVLVMFLLTAVIGSALFAQERTPVQLPDTLSDYNAKGTKIAVTKPNIFKVSGNRQDLSAVYLRDIPYKGQKTLVVKVLSMEGKFRWDHGKMFAVTTGSPNDAKGPFINPNPPSTKTTMDKLLDGPFEVGEELVFNLPAEFAKQSKITFAISLYAGATYELELWFE